MTKNLKALNGRIQFLYENSLFLIGGSIMALIWANLDHHNYEEVAHGLHFWVNDIGMCLFFGIAAKEIWEALLPGGVLSSPKKAGLPLMATFGGMAGPALLFVGLCVFFGQQQLMNGWAIPCATDIAFSYLIARMIFGSRKHPAIPFLLLLAIADDALGLIILAVFYPTGDVSMLAFFGLVGAAMAAAYYLRQRDVRNFWYYLIIPGVISWFGFHYGGIHPALALVPIIPFLPHAKHDIGVFRPEERRRINTLDRFADWWKNHVELILGAFGFVNAGVALTNVGHATLFVLVALLLGKTIGITLCTKLGMMLGLKLPRGMHMPDVIALSITAAIGFTVALFVATVAYPRGPILEAAKMGATASFIAAPIALLVARFLPIKKVFLDKKE